MWCGQAFGGIGVLFIFFELKRQMIRLGAAEETMEKPQEGHVI
jgi:hypothetical protein